MKLNNKQTIFGLLRIGMGWIFFWSFLDKLFGLGFATEAGKGWIDGFSPTVGFLKFATKGPFASFYQGLAGSAVVDWLFMVGLALVGLALMLGIGMRLAAWGGALMLVFMYTAGFIWPEHNPFLDEHIIYALLVIALSMVPSGEWLGFGRQWSNSALVKKYPILR